MEKVLIKEIKGKIVLLILFVFFFSFFNLKGVNLFYGGKSEYGVLETNDIRDKLYRVHHSQLKLDDYFVNRPQLELKWKNITDFVWFNLTDYDVDKYEFHYLNNKFSLDSKFYLSDQVLLGIGVNVALLKDSFSPYDDNAYDLTQYFLDDILFHKQDDAVLFYRMKDYGLHLNDKYSLLEEDILYEYLKRGADFFYSFYFNDSSSLEVDAHYTNKDYRYDDSSDYSYGDVKISYLKTWKSEEDNQTDSEANKAEISSNAQFLFDKNVEKQLSLQHFKTYKSYFEPQLKGIKPVKNRQLEVSYIGRFNNQPHSPYGDFNLNGIKLAFTTNFSDTSYITLYDQFEYQEYDPEAIYYETNRANEIGYLNYLPLGKKFYFSSNGFYRFRNDMHFSQESYYLGYISGAFTYYFKDKFKGIASFIPSFTYFNYDQTDLDHNDYGDYSFVLTYQLSLNEMIDMGLGYEYRRLYYDNPDDKDYSNFNNQVFSLQFALNPLFLKDARWGNFNFKGKLEMGIRIENLNYEQKPQDSQQKYFTWIGWRSLLF